MPDAPLTCLDFWIKAGSSFETCGEEGVAHFLEHMVFKGGDNLKEGEFDREIEALGGSSNAATGLDDVHFYVLVPPDSVSHALNLLLELVLCPRLDRKAFEIEKEVVLEEIAQTNDVPEEEVFKELLKMCWGKHSYGRPVLGYKSSLRAMTPEQMKSFHERRYQGENCALAISGKIPAKIETIIRESPLSTIKNRKNLNEIKNDYQKLGFIKQRKEISIDRLETSRLLMAWPILGAEEQLTVMGADIATSLLCEGRRSLLVNHLRENLQLVESIEMDITILEEGGLILLEACCKEDQLIHVEEEIHLLLKNLLIDPLKEKEVSRACQLVKNSLYFSLELSSNVSSIAGSHALWGRHQSLLTPLEYIDYWTGPKLQQELLINIQAHNCSTLIARPA